MKVAVYGAGAVGGYFGGRLAQAGASVHLIARGPQLQALRRGGLRVRSVRGDFEVQLLATDDPAEVGPCDLVMFCVKSFDTEAAAACLGPLITRETAVLSLQNGVDNEEKIARAVGWEHVLGGVAYIFAAVTEPGLVVDTGGPGRIVFGEWDGSSSARVVDLLEWFRKAQVDAQLSREIRSALWYKFAFICAQAGMTAVTRLPIGRIRSQPESWAMFPRLLEEVCAVADEVRVRLPTDTVERHLKFAEGLEPHGYSSLYQDLTSGRRLELEALHGTVVRLGHKHGVEVPASEVVYAILKAWDGHLI